MTFEKLCEKMITGEPVPQKDILDERQKIIQQKAAVNALTFYGAAVTLNIMIMEAGAKWCESFFGATTLFIPIAYIYFLIICARKGALVGVNGSSQVKFPAFNMISIGAIMASKQLFGRGENEGFAVVRNGMLSEDFVIILFYVLMIATGITALVMIRKNGREKDD